MFKLLFLTISLLTCSPGEPLYSHYGHTAIRVQDPEHDLDIVFNYGLFSFETEHFYWKFVKGETYYQLGIQEGRYVEEEYREEERTIYTQELNLTPEQQDRIMSALWNNYLPSNRTYLYNFVFDNCATRPYLLIKNALGQDIQSDYTGWQGRTYREFIHHYTGPGSWADFGINMVFGRRADQPMCGEQTLFLPEELMKYLQQAHFEDGTPVVKAGTIGDFAIRRTPWYATWYFGAGVFALLMLALSLYDRRRGKMAYGVDIALGVIYLILVALIIFLSCFSIHPLVGLNIRLFLFPFIHLCTRLVYILR